MTSASTSAVTKTQLLETVQQYEASYAWLTERIADLELALEDTGWQRLVQDGEQEFSRDGLRRIARMARLMYLKNPLINRGVSVTAHYVWGQGCSIQAKDPAINTVVQAFLDDQKNRDELTGHQARMLKEVDLELEGNIFFVFFPHQVTGRVQLRTVPPDEVDDIICNPEDRKEPWYYRRTWTEQRLNLATGELTPTKRAAYYPDWRYLPASRPARIGDVEVRWQSPVYHVKVGGLSEMRFGVSELYAALDWARAYKSFLEDWATITRAYATFAFKATTGGGKKGVQAAKTRLGTTMSPTATETNPRAVTGSTLVVAEGNDLEPIKTAGATTKAEDGRRIMLMVAAAVGLPETFFGDVSVGTLATATSLDRPTELKMRDRQTLWADVHANILSYVLYWAARATSGPLRARGKLRAPDTLEIVWSDGGDPHIDIDFPPVIAIDTAQRVTAINTVSEHVPDERLIARLMLQALGEDDIDELLDAYFDDDGRLKDAYRPAPLVLGGEPDASAPQPDDQTRQEKP